MINATNNSRQANLFERSLREQVTLDTRQSLVRVVIRLLNETELLPLWLVQSTLHTTRTQSMSLLYFNYSTYTVVQKTLHKV